MIHYISPAPLTFETIDAILNKHYTLALSDESKQLITNITPSPSPTRASSSSTTAKPI